MIITHSFATHGTFGVTDMSLLNTSHRPDKRPAMPSARAPTKEEREARTVHVGNMWYESKEEDLREIMEYVSRVERIDIPKDPSTGKTKGFAFVEYPDRACAESAVRNLVDMVLDGRKLVVNQRCSGGQSAGQAGGKRPLRNADDCDDNLELNRTENRREDVFQRRKRERMQRASRH